MKWLVIFATCLVLCSCSRRHKVGQYVYVDCLNTIHVERACASKFAEKAKTKEERIMSAKGVAFIDTCDLVNSTTIMPGAYPITFCPKCIDDYSYKQISSIMDRNEIKPPAY